MTTGVSASDLRTPKTGRGLPPHASLIPGRPKTSAPRKSRLGQALKLAGLSGIEAITVRSPEISHYFVLGLPRSLSSATLFDSAVLLVQATGTPAPKWDTRGPKGEWHGFFDEWSRLGVAPATDDAFLDVVDFGITEPFVPSHRAAHSHDKWSFITDWTTNLPEVVDSPTLPSIEADPRTREAERAFAAFTELRGWLKLSVPDAAQLIGVGRTTPVTSWKAGDHPPRPRTARRLYQLHGLVGAVVRQMGEPDMVAWFSDAKRNDLLRRSDLTALADEVEQLVIRHSPSVGPAPGSDIAPAGTADLPVRGRRQRAVARRRK